jgi:hypothetical protein
LPEKDPPFSYVVSFSFSFQKSSPIYNFDRAFEAILKKDYKETLKRCNFRNPRR